jgi:hypothetical protein
MRDTRLNFQPRLALQLFAWFPFLAPEKESALNDGCDPKLRNVSVVKRLADRIARIVRRDNPAQQN